MTQPRVPARRRRPHPARNARRIAGASSVAGMFALVGWMAAGTHTTTTRATTSATLSSSDDDSSLATTATVSSATSAANATSATPQVVTVSSGS